MGISFGETKKAINSGVDFSKGLSALSDFGDLVNNEGGFLSPDTAGGFESALFGSPAANASETQTGLQSLAGGVAELFSDDFARGRAARSQLISFDFKNAYESLKGAGQITEFESKTAAGAESLFANRSATREQLQREVKRLEEGLSGGQFRSNNNITITDNGIETMTQDGVKKNVLTYRDPETGNYEVLDVPDGRTIYNIPDWLDPDVAKDAASSLPKNSEYFYKGKVYNRDNI